MFRKDAPPADLCSFQLQSLAPFLSLLCITAATQEMLTVVKMQCRMPSNTILVGINEPVALHTAVVCTVYAFSLGNINSLQYRAGGVVICS